jgi:hypothetical protein
MFKVVLYVLIVLCIIHSIIYYFNIDVFYIKQKPNEYIFSSKSKFAKSNEINNISIDCINDCINELKTLNECINNGQINNTFPQN